MDRQLFTNNAQTTLATAITAGDTSITLTDGSVFSTVIADTFELLTIADSAGVVEIVKMTTRSGNTATVVRAQESTSAQIWGAGTTIYARATAGTYGAIQAPFTTDASLLAMLYQGITPVSLLTSALDLTVTAADDIWELTFPSGVYFFPDSCGVLGSDQNTITVQPEIEIGTSSDTDAIVAQEALTIEAPNDDRDVLTLVSGADLIGVQTLSVSLKVAATATTYDAIVYFTGMLRDIN